MSGSGAVAIPNPQTQIEFDKVVELKEQMDRLIMLLEKVVYHLEIITGEEI